MNKYFALAVITLVEATIGIFVKLTGDAVPIYTLNFYRAFFAFILLACTVPFLDNAYKLKSNIKPIAIIGLLIAAQMSLFNIAMTLVPVANAVVYWSTNPFFVFLISWWFLGEKPTWKHIGIFILAFIGLLIARPISGEYAIGNLVALSTGLTYALLIAYMRYEGKTQSSGIVLWYLMFASLFTLPGIIIFGPGELMKITSGMPAIVWVLCLGMISTGMAYLMMGYVLKQLSANVYALFDVIVSPLVAAIMAYLILSEVPHTRLAIGGAIMILAGFWLTSELESSPRAEVIE